MKQVPHNSHSMAGWVGYHLFYHGDRDLALRSFIAPTVQSLWSERKIDSFFFVRFCLGGPHLRLRLRPHPDRADDLSADLARAAADFLARHPSNQPWSDEQILRENRAILASDAHEYDGSIYPDNFFRRFQVHLEIERYGGPALLGTSLDFFALSSASALRVLAALAGEPAARRLPAMFRILARQAFGLASDERELLALLEYAVGLWEPLSSFAERADALFETRHHSLVQLLVAEIEALSRGPSLETEAAHRLAQQISPAEPVVRRRILLSQMHMTANRLGLLNPEEVYLARLLGRTARTLATLSPGIRDEFRGFLSARQNAAPTAGLEELLPTAFAGLRGKVGEHQESLEEHGAARLIDGGHETCSTTG